MKKIEEIELIVYPETVAPWEEIQDKLNELIAAVNELIETSITIKPGVGQPKQADFLEFKKDK